MPPAAVDTGGELTQAENRWSAAVQAGDTAALERIFTDRLIYTHSSGLIESKSDYIGRLRAGKLKYEAIEYLSLRPEGYGDSGVVAARVRMKGSSAGKPFNDVLLMLHVWVKRQGQWQLAAHQTTEPH